MLILISHERKHMLFTRYKKDCYNKKYSNKLYFKINGRRKFTICGYCINI